jgi:hypothetical protein
VPELDLHTLDPAKKGVTMLIIPPDPIHPKLKAGNKEPNLINYQARNVSVTTVLIEIAKQAKHDLYLTSAGVIFCPPGNAPFPNKLAKKGLIWDVLHKHQIAGKKNAPKIKTEPRRFLTPPKAALSKLFFSFPHFSLSRPLLTRQKIFMLIPLPPATLCLPLSVLSNNVLRGTT